MNPVRDVLFHRKALHFVLKTIRFPMKQKSPAKARLRSPPQCPSLAAQRKVFQKFLDKGKRSSYRYRVTAAFALYNVGNVILECGTA